MEVVKSLLASTTLEQPFEQLVHIIEFLCCWREGNSDSLGEMLECSVEDSVFLTSAFPNVMVNTEISCLFPVFWSGGGNSLALSSHLLSVIRHKEMTLSLPVCFQNKFSPGYSLVDKNCLISYYNIKSLLTHKNIFKNHTTSTLQRKWHLPASLCLCRFKVSKIFDSDLLSPHSQVFKDQEQKKIDSKHILYLLFQP